MSVLPVTIQIPTPSAEESVLIQKHEIAVFSYIATTVRVYIRWASDEPASPISDPKDSILFRVEDVWYIQQLRDDDTIEMSLASLFSIQSWQVVGHAPVLMVKPKEAEGWRGEVMKPNDFYKGYWSSLFEQWADGETEKMRLEFAFEIRRDFRCDQERADKLGFPRRIRKIRESLYKKDDPKLYYTYSEYLNFYVSSLPENSTETWARLREYFRSKALRAAAEEGLTEVDPILNSDLAIRDGTDAAKAIGELDEDWYYYG